VVREEERTKHRRVFGRMPNTAGGTPTLPLAAEAWRDAPHTVWSRMLQPRAAQAGARAGPVRGHEERDETSLLLILMNELWAERPRSLICPSRRRASR
jgi:hypothetical protein